MLSVFLGGAAVTCGSRPETARNVSMGANQFDPN